jgi:AcrR family transcriptional regulator
MTRMIKSSNKTKQIQRRKPKHARSEATVELIFEASARILAQDGRAGFNTNRIAEVAGISVGTLYGYFPDKQAILLAMARRELDALRDRVAAALMDADSEVHPARRAVRALINAYSVRGKVRRVLMETLFSHGGSEELARPVGEIAEIIVALAGELLPTGPERLSPVGLYVLTRAIDSVVRTANYEGMEFRQSSEFEDELMRLIFSFLGWPLADEIGGSGRVSNEPSSQRGR